MSGDGCSDFCLIEDGYDCQGAPSTCSRTTCGNMTLEAGEGCDDGNLVPFDGCDSECRREPTCVTGMPCTSPCGDAIVHGNEECDDGNRRNGDGCSSTCAVEAGFACDPEPCVMQNGVCTIRQPLAVRDFNRSTAVGGHPDFRPGYASTGAITGLVEAMLDDAGKPVLSSTATPTHGFMHGAAAFAQWYRNAPPASAPIQRMLVLWDDQSGGFVNRWGASGQRWVAYTNATFCSNTDCGACETAPPGQVCRSPCPAWLSGACFTTPVEYDGNPLYFPIDTGSGLLTDLRSEGKVPEQYGYPGWPWESSVATTLGVSSPIPTATAMFPSATHNFDFTTEARLWFKYDADITQRIAFTGDDDAWVFVNGKLAIDLGGWHVPLGGSATLSQGSYSLVQGNLYEVAIFHAERQTEGSSYQLSVTGLNSPRSRCHAR
jgi:fibro-slime domain-containing protein